MICRKTFVFSYEIGLLCFGTRGNRRKVTFFIIFSQKNSKRVSLFLLIDVIRDMVNCTLHLDDLCILYNLPKLMNTFIIVFSRTPKVFQPQIYKYVQMEYLKKQDMNSAQKEFMSHFCRRPFEPVCGIWHTIKIVHISQNLRFQHIQRIILIILFISKYIWMYLCGSALEFDVY